MKLEIGPPSADISSVTEAIDLLESNEALRLTRPVKGLKSGHTHFGLWFRGHSCTSHVLVPSLLRYSKAQTNRYFDEVSLVRHFRAMNCDAVAPNATDFEVLVTMQHYLAPTRLLDWTENLLVGLHFAVRDPELDDQDAALWILNAPKLNYFTSVSSRRSQVLFENELDVLARSCLIRVTTRQEWYDLLIRLIRTTVIDNQEYRIDRVKMAKDIRLLGEQVNEFLAKPVDLRKLQVVSGNQVVHRDLAASPHWTTPEMLDVRLRLPVAVYPNRANRRIRAQSGCFTLHGGKFNEIPERYKKGELYPSAIGVPISLHEIDQSLKSNTQRILEWVRIPRENRNRIRHTLARIGITDASLFPELDYQSRYLRDQWIIDASEIKD